MAKAKEKGETISDSVADVATLPPRVKAIRDKILEACAKRDIEALRIPIDWNETRPMFERGARRTPGEDPIERLKALSFDGKGAEIIALLRAVLAEPFVIVTRGPTRLYVWPAFSMKAPVDPTPDQREAMLACIRFADLRAGGAPAPMQLGIGADGTWHWFWTAAPAPR